MHTIVGFFRRNPWIGLIPAIAIGVAIALTSIHVVRTVFMPQRTVATSTQAQLIRRGTAPLPVYTEEIHARIASSNGFAAVLSYTDFGFEPTELRITAGEVVRFTNNSSHDVWIAADDRVRVYPRTSDSCGSSDLDSCAPIAPMDFWEFTFTEPGEWSVVNNLDKSHRVTVTVE